MPVTGCLKRKEKKGAYAKSCAFRTALHAAGGAIQEISMIRSSPSTIMHDFKNTNLSSSAKDSVSRDTTQSRPLHEPSYRICTVDSKTGDDLKDIPRHLSLVKIKGNVTTFTCHI